MTEPVVLVDVADRIATITLNRPERRNAINGALGVGLARAVGDAEANDDVDVMILTGADPAFCAGADLKELSSGAAAAVPGIQQGDQPTPVVDGASAVSSGDPAEPDSPADHDDPYRRDEFGMYPFRGPFPPHTKLLIGAINGPAITGGFELALNCDLLIASDHAAFADTHARVGIMPGWGLTVLLVETIGLRRAREMSATGNFIDADTAFAWGLVNHVVPHHDLLSFTRDLALGAVQNDQRAVRRMLQTYGDIAASIYDDAWEIEKVVNRDWLAGGIDAADVARRRDEVIERGRGQVEG